jgi:hypothetical protein
MARFSHAISGQNNRKRAFTHISRIAILFKQLQQLLQVGLAHHIGRAPQPPEKAQKGTIIELAAMPPLKLAERGMQLGVGHLELERAYHGSNVCGKMVSGVNHVLADHSFDQRTKKEHAPASCTSPDDGAAKSAKISANVASSASLNLGADALCGIEAPATGTMEARRRCCILSLPVIDTRWSSTQEQPASRSTATNFEVDVKTISNLKSCFFFFGF